MYIIYFLGYGIFVYTLFIIAAILIGDGKSQKAVSENKYEDNIYEMGYQTICQLMITWYFTFYDTSALQCEFYCNYIAVFFSFFSSLFLFFKGLLWGF